MDGSHCPSHSLRLGHAARAKTAESAPQAAPLLCRRRTHPPLLPPPSLPRLTQAALLNISNPCPTPARTPHAVAKPRDLMSHQLYTTASAPFGRPLMLAPPRSVRHHPCLPPIYLCRHRPSSLPLSFLRACVWGGLAGFSPARHAQALGAGRRCLSYLPCPHAPTPPHVGREADSRAKSDSARASFVWRWWYSKQTLHTLS